MNPDGHLLPITLQGHVLHEESYQSFTVLLRRCWSGPHLLEVLQEIEKSPVLRTLQRSWMRVGPLSVFFLEPLEFLEFLIPRSLQGPRYQPVLGFYRVVLPERSPGIVLGCFDPKFPALFFLTVVLLDFSGNLQCSLNVL